VAVVTGASSGIGRRLALDLAERGATVVAIARREDPLAALAMDLRACTPKSGYEVCDVANTVALARVLTSIEEAHGRIDVLVNNAGQDTMPRWRDATVADFERLFAVNFFAAVAGTYQVLPGMLARGAGVVANMSSDAARFPNPGAGAYAASKAALSAFSESISYRAARHGVCVHVIYPAWVPTELGQSPLRKGVRKPPRIVRRTEEQVASRIVERLGSSSLEISLSRLTNFAVLVRAVAPRSYRRVRSKLM
jgi:short-subunit dehydrogenase